MTKAVLGAYWDARAASVDECADLIATCLPALSAVDPLLAEWRDKAQSRREAAAQPIVTTNHDDLVARLLRGRNRTDVGNHVIEELGYAVSWWNGRETREGGITLRIHLGVTSQHVGNAVVVNLPDSRMFPHLYEAQTARKLLTAVIEIFEPERANWASPELKTAQAEPDQPLENGGIAYGQLKGHPAGWTTYLSTTSDIRFTESLLPPTASVERLPSGTLVTIGDNPADPPIRDVLTVRVAMGYPPPADLTPNEADRSSGAAIAETATRQGIAPVGSDSPTVDQKQEPRPKAHPDS